METTKRIIALLLCLTMIFTLAACGSSDNSSASAKETSSMPSEGTTDEDSNDANNDLVSFTLTSYNTITGVDYTSDALYDYIADKFNISVEVWSCEASAADEKQRMWISGGTMPNVMKWDSFNFSEYYSYADQGLLHALPEGWEAKWPNIAKLVKASGVSDLLDVDGKLYGIPCSVFGNNLSFERVPSHSSLYFRKDWAKQVGMDDMGRDYKVSLSELRDYLEKVGEAGLVDNAVFGSGLNATILNFFWGSGVNTNSFIDTGSEWIWGPCQENVTSTIALMREWYQAGLLDRDFYTKGNEEYINAFTADQIAASFYNGNADGFARNRRNYKEASPDRDGYEDIGVAAITTDAGTAYSTESGNYWTVNVFNPDTDEKTLSRILDLIDWIASDEGQAAEQLGVPEVDWKFNGDGRPEVINDVKYPSTDAFYLLGYCLDDFQMSGVSPSIAEQDLDETRAIYAAKEAGTIFHYPWSYAISTSDAKNNYSVNWNDKVAELVVNTDDIESSWNSFIEENKALWEPMVEELNASSGY